MEFRLIQPDDKAFRGSGIVLKLTEVQRTDLKLFCGALRSPVSCSSRSDLTVNSVDLPEMMLDRSTSIASTLGGSLERELRVIKATRIDHQASFLADPRERLIGAARTTYRQSQGSTKSFRSVLWTSVSFSTISDPRNGSQSLDNVIWAYKSNLQASLLS